MPALESGSAASPIREQASLDTASHVYPACSIPDLDSATAEPAGPTCDPPNLECVDPAAPTVSDLQTAGCDDGLPEDWEIDAWINEARERQASRYTFFKPAW